MSKGLDLGDLNGPVLVFGGPYGNFEATQAVLAEAERRGIPPSRTICTGDIAAYCADPQATADLLRSLEIPIVRGNCEISLSEGSHDCGCGFKEGGACHLLSRDWYAYCAENLDPETKAWMGRLPRRIGFSMAGKKVLALHGGAKKVNRYLFSSSSKQDKRAEIDEAGADVVLAGHSGLPFIQEIDGRIWFNPGVVGMPANDGTPRVWFGVIAPNEAGIRIELRPLRYDHEKAAGKMAGKGLPRGYARALATGLWPSLDVLPAAERGNTGTPIASWTASFPGPGSRPFRNLL